MEQLLAVQLAEGQQQLPAQLGLVRRKGWRWRVAGDEETTDLTPLIKAGEVAWLFGPGGAKGRVSALDDVRSAPQPAAAAGTKRQRSHAAALAAAGAASRFWPGASLKLRRAFVWGALK